MGMKARKPLRWVTHSPLREDSELPKLSARAHSMNLVVCETSVAITTHLRILTSGEEPNYHGTDGTVSTLCGKRSGWDTRIPIDQVRCSECRFAVGEEPMKDQGENKDLTKDLHSKEYKKTICVDFDGVIHWYRSGWNGGDIYDEPVPGAIDFLKKLIASDRLIVAIYSSRSKYEGGIQKMKDWLFSNSLSMEELEEIQFPFQKPAAWITIDDRAFHFRGNFPTISYLYEFEPWMKDGDSELALDISLLRVIASDSTAVNDQEAARLQRIADRLAGVGLNEL